MEQFCSGEGMKDWRAWKFTCQISSVFIKIGTEAQCLKMKMVKILLKSIFDMLLNLIKLNHREMANK